MAASVQKGAHEARVVTLGPNRTALFYAAGNLVLVDGHAAWMLDERAMKRLVAGWCENELRRRGVLPAEVQQVLDELAASQPAGDAETVEEAPGPQ